MDEDSARERMRALAARINEADESYYGLDSPVMTDAEYDALARELAELESAFPGLAAPDSPAGRVGGGVSEGFEKTVHLRRQLSLSNAYSRQELEDFDARARKLASSHFRYALEHKYDGLTVVLTYRAGKLVTGATRGDGEVGENVTANIRTIKNVPTALKDPLDLTVRGEAIMPRAGFEELNRLRASQGLTLFSNPRNAAAGSLRQLDSQLAASRPLEVIVFSLEDPEGALPTHHEALEMLSAQGFTTSEVSLHQDLASLIVRLDAVEAGRAALPYETDGAVIKIDELAVRDELGSTSKSPRWAVAYKFSPEEAQTTLLDVSVQVGRTGVLTPVAVLSPVMLSGSRVGRATLHNADFVQQKDVRIGDRVVIRKAGEIIPEVVRSLPENRTGEEREFTMPAECPACGSPVRREEGFSAVRCVNPACPAQLVRRITHFASKGAADIAGLGPQMVERLVRDGYLGCIEDIYSLKDRRSDLCGEKNLGTKSVDALLAAVDASRSMTLERLIYALGIPQIGESSARDLAGAFGSVENLASADAQALTGVENIGETTAGAVIEFFASPQTALMLSRLSQLGVSARPPAAVSAGSGALGGKTFVLTGTLPTMGRLEASELIRSHGGTVSGSLGKKTDYLLAGENPGSKLDKAASLSVPVISEDGLRAMIGAGGDPE